MAKTWFLTWKVTTRDDFHPDGENELDVVRAEVNACLDEIGVDAELVDVGDRLAGEDDDGA